MEARKKKVQSQSTAEVSDVKDQAVVPEEHKKEDVGIADEEDANVKTSMAKLDLKDDKEKTSMNKLPRTSTMTE